MLAGDPDARPPFRPPTEREEEEEVIINLLPADENMSSDQLDLDAAQQPPVQNLNSIRSRNGPGRGGDGDGSFPQQRPGGEQYDYSHFDYVNQRVTESGMKNGRLNMDYDYSEDEVKFVNTCG